MLPTPPSMLPTPPSNFDISERICNVRGNRIVLDADLAAFYEISTKHLNEHVKRNSHLYPSDFVFRLTDSEFENLKIQYPNLSHRGGTRYLPYAYTKHGALMAATKLRKSKAQEVCLKLIRAFGESNEREPSTRDLNQRLQLLEKSVVQIQQTILTTKDKSDPISSSRVEPRRQKSYSIDVYDPTLRAVAQYFGVQVKDLKAQSRKRAFAIPRQIAMYLLRKNEKLGLSDIGHYLGGRDHTTVLYACEKIEEELKSDSRTSKAVTELEKLLKGDLQ